MDDQYYSDDAPNDEEFDDRCCKAIRLSLHAKGKPLSDLTLIYSTFDCKYSLFSLLNWQIVCDRPSSAYDQDRSLSVHLHASATCPPLA